MRDQDLQEAGFRAANVYHSPILTSLVAARVVRPTPVDSYEGCNHGCRDKLPSEPAESFIQLERHYSAVESSPANLPLISSRQARKCILVSQAQQGFSVVAIPTPRILEGRITPWARSLVTLTNCPTKYQFFNWLGLLQQISQCVHWLFCSLPITLS